MSKLLISYVNDWAAGTVTASTEHPSFPAVNTQHRWFKKPWRSKYGTGSSWGLFRITAAKCKIYFDEGGADLVATLAAGDYDATTLLAEIKSKMDAAGATYTPAFSDVTMKFSIAITAGTFRLQLSKQTDAAWDALGFTGLVDTALAASHTADEIRVHTSEFLYCNAGATKTIKFLGLKNHNLQSTAIITARYYSDAFVTLVDSEVLTWHAGQIAIRTAKSYQYAALELSDPSNPAGYIEGGLVWMGDVNVLHYGFTAERTKTPEDPSIESESEDGQSSTIQLSKFAGWTYSFDAVEPNTDKAALEAIFAEIGKTRPCMIVEAPPVSGDIGLLAQYVKFTSWEWPHVAGTYWALNLEVRSER